MVKNLYYNIKPYVPHRTLLAARRIFLRLRKRRHNHVWPIFENAGSAPQGWGVWPDGKKFALVLTHDVEGTLGQARCRGLMQLEEKLGFRSCFYFPTNRYPVAGEVIRELQDHGFEIGIHGVKHDGKLFKNRFIFNRRAPRINHFLSQWQSTGFRSPSMHHNLEWIQELDIKYDSSTTDTDPFEPQCCGISTIFPFIVKDKLTQKSYVELPYTLTQDFSLYVLLREKNIDIWKTKLDWIAGQGGMALLLTHPDYMNLGSGLGSATEYPSAFYEQFLEYLKTKYAGQYWHALPRDVAELWQKVAPTLDERGIWDDHDPQLLCSTCRKFLVQESSGHKKPVIQEQPQASFTATSRKTEKKIALNVCMLAYTFYENDNRVKRYAEALVRRGAEVDVIALRRFNQSRFERINGINVYRIQERIINEKKKLTYLYRLIRFLIGSAYQVTKRHWRKSYDVIHTHSIPDFEVFATLIPKLTGAKIILDIHDIVPELYASKFQVTEESFWYKCLILLEKVSIGYSDHVIIANDLWLDVLLARSVKNGKCDVFLNYPDPNIFYQRPEGEKNHKTVLIYPGTLLHHQGLDVAFRALALIKDQVPNVEFQIYGDGPHKPELVDLARELSLEDQIVFSDFLPMEQVADAMARADLGVVPKRKDSFGNEAFSTKIFEFMALGVPVVAADTRIDKFYFNDSVIQFFESGNENDLARCLLLMIQDTRLRNRQAQNALDFVRKYSWDSHQEKYFTLLARLRAGR